MMNIYKFSGRGHPFSNFYPAKATYEGMMFANGEAAFQAAKTLDKTQRTAFTNIAPGIAKRYGRGLKLRSDWEAVKHNVMLDVLRSKFNDPVLKEQLLNTGNMLIVEDTTGWHDNEWGDCACARCAGITGKNKLGKALMQIRKELRGLDNG